MLQSATGEIDDEKVRKNMDLAMEAYISRVNHCRCGNSSIHLFRGADASVHLGTRDDLLTFLKGSKSAKESLHQKNPTLYAHFQFCVTVPNSAYDKGSSTCLNLIVHAQLALMKIIIYDPTDELDSEPKWSNQSWFQCGLLLYSHELFLRTPRPCGSLDVRGF